MNDKKYEEVGVNYRFFLKWRHASFAGNVLILYGVISLCISTYRDSPTLAWIVPLLASPIGILLWIIDVRTRDAYHAARNAGKELEGDEGGFYTKLSEEVALPRDSSPFKEFIKSHTLSHSVALDIFFIGSSVMLLITSAMLLINAVVLFVKSIYQGC